MNEKFPYGYDVNAYIDKALERMKELYPGRRKKCSGKSGPTPSNKKTANINM